MLIYFAPFESVRQSMSNGHTIRFDPRLMYTSKSTFVHACIACISGPVKNGDIERWCAGHSLNSRDESGRTPLHTAICVGAHVSTVIALVRMGANINAQDYRGRTPLHYARYTPDTFKELVRLGANVELADFYGSSVFE